LLTNLGLADSEASVYLALVVGARSAREIVKATGLKRPTVYYALGALERRGLLAKTGASGNSAFALAPVEHLVTLAGEEVSRAEALAQGIKESLPFFTPTATSTKRPSVAFFEGKEAVERVIMDMMYSKEKSIDILAPTDNFFWQVGRDFVERFVTERGNRGIRTRSLWDAPIKKPIFKTYYEGLSEVRIVPSVMRGKFATSVFLYDDQTLYISSLKNSYAVLLTSKEHHDTMQAWFEALWLASRHHAGK
ncbi:MAG: helix-turn-helix domain-containing protein, partial [bacterium]|nr:helix-turn-helix domain-containing protein [bacterium]